MPGGGGFGHIADMIARIKANETLKHEILQRRFKYVYYKTSSVIQPARREATQVNVEAIRQKMREESRKDRIKSVWAFIISVIFVAAIYFVAQYIWYKIID